MGLLAVLVWAVFRTADNSSGPPEPVEFATSSATSSTYTTSSTSTPSYSVPNVQTSQDNPVITGPTQSSSTDDGFDDDETTTSTTATNPYVTTTTSNAGHI